MLLAGHLGVVQHQQALEPSPADQQQDGSARKKKKRKNKKEAGIYWQKYLERIYEGDTYHKAKNVLIFYSKLR